ncbi:amino acid ABC transporter substrate-binding protein [Agrobacterium tumefaciens]|uniref:amino acid ABC transporter substrate-binding protein n=1 Tax=Agrobacterium tumefaciens TaxID=358 RepID=UPI00287CC5E5|nr:amino acid ABC transporter substrate-binding protein [Agrobacterium tumefaciens]MDS7595627.1 amino acid ABC transporter substrate-binding protein [Agrobacterium tumefaciens]
MRGSVLWLASVISAIAPALAAATGSQPPTLETIARTGIIRIGYGDNNTPFSYLGTEPTPIGYSIELCMRVTEAIREKLGRPDIKVEFVERTPSNRIPMLNSGAIDLECVSSTNTEERRKAVWFSYDLFLTGTRYVALKSSGLTTLDDLAGRTVSVTTGTINISQLNALNRRKNMSIAVVQSDSTKGGFDMVTEGRASAFIMDDILLRSFVAETGKPEDYSISSDYLAPPQPYGLMMRHGDLEFKETVNGALAKIYASGEIEKIYDKWFNAPIPPHGMNLRRPLPEDLAQAFRNPVDSTQ